MSEITHHQQDRFCDQNILIVDDIEANIFALELFLNKLGAGLLRANSGNEALTMLLNYDVSLVLLDVQMPGMGGFEVAEIMRGHAETASIPLVFITALSREKEHIFRGYELGAVDYILKPVDPAVLVKKVELYLKMETQMRNIKKLPVSFSDIGATGFNASMTRLRTWGRQQKEQVMVARDVQKALLPLEHFSEGGWEIETFLEPSSDVSGDYVDFINLGGSKVGLVLADISGHDIPAALVTGMIHAWCHASWKHSTQLSAFASSLNGYLFQNTLPEMYASIFLGILDTRSGRLEYILAGHPEPLLLRNGKASLLDETRQPVMGMMPTTPQILNELILQKGDRLLVYSDGLSDEIGDPERPFASLLEPHLNKLDEGGISGFFTNLVSSRTLPTPQDDVTMLMVSFGENKSNQEISSDRQQKRILLVEDDPVSRSLLSKVLEKNGFCCVCAQNAKEAFEYFHAESFDILVTDIHLPGGVSGHEVIRHVKKVSPIMPVIIITADQSEDQVLMGQRMGADYYMTKPFNTNELIMNLHMMLGVDTKRSRITMEKRGDHQYQFWLTSSEESLLTIRSFIDALLLDQRCPQFSENCQKGSSNGVKKCAVGVIDNPLRLCGERLDQLQYCIQEIGKNAIEWGNRMDPNLRVSVSLEVEAEAIRVRIANKGKGFNVKAMLASLEDFDGYQKQREEEGLRPGGFGLKIVQSMADSIDFNENGTEMEMVFFKNPQCCQQGKT